MNAIYRDPNASIGAAVSGTSPLAALIASLSGGAGNIRPNQAARQGAIGEAQAAQQDYSKEAAFTDAAGLITQALHQQMAESMPTIVRAADGAGASAGSMRALLTQKAATDAATAAAAQGANLAVQYGGIANDSGQLLEALTRSDPTELNALLEAMRLQADIRNNNKQMALQKEGTRERQVFNNSGQSKQIGSSAPAPRPGSGGAVASFAPAPAQASTAGFFGRKGGIADNSGGPAFFAGPTTSDQALLQRLQQGLTPMQTWEGTPVPSDMYDTSPKF
jgi:hypothetical protein